MSSKKPEFHSTPLAHDRQGLTFRVLVHLDLMEDPLGRNGSAAPHDYMWHYNVVIRGCHVTASTLCLLTSTTTVVTTKTKTTVDVGAMNIRATTEAHASSAACHVRPRGGIGSAQS